MFQKLTPDAQTAWRASAKAAARLGSTSVQPGHLLLGLLSVTGSAPSLGLVASGVRATAVAAWLAQRHQGSAAGTGLSPELIRVLQTITRLEHPVTDVDVAQVLLTGDVTEVRDLLTACGTTREEVLDRIAEFAAVRTATASPATGSGTPAGVRPAAGADAQTSGYYTDMVSAADTFDVVVGRDEELRRVMRVLSRRAKNNPVLVGDPGVGKTAVVEALAARLATGAVPAALTGRPLWRVDVAALMAGARFRGDLEERLKALTAAAERDRAILFIDEIHMLVAGSGTESGGIDAGNLLKEALARGQVTIVGATTAKEYRTKLTADAALERRFTPVEVPETTPEQTAEILTRLAPAYATHHGVTYTADALEAAARLADRHIRDRFNPDKAVDVLDEAGAQVALAHSLGESSGPPVVTREVVAAVVEGIAGVAVTANEVTERQALLELDATLAGRVVGQPAAVSAVARAVRRRRGGLGQRSRPASLLFAGPTGVGKTELAKALAETLFRGDRPGVRGRLVRFDMSEFTEKHSVARLLGAPPGYLGHDAGGQLTEAVRRNPSAVVLLDEFDKAHPDIADALLGVLDDGRMTDGQGRTVDFRDTVVVLTTNTGADQVARAVTGFGPSDADADAVTRKALRDTFRPEFLNRLDEVVVFTALEPHQLHTIAAKMVADLVTGAAAEGVTVTVSSDVVDLVVAEGTNSAYGARPLRRTLERLVLDPLTAALLTTDARALCVTLDDHGQVAVAVSETVVA